MSIPGSGLQIEGVLVYFTHLKRQKHIGDDVGEGLQIRFYKQKKIFFLVKMSNEQITRISRCPNRQVSHMCNLL
jgi:hypothetical protein